MRFSLQCRPNSPEGIRRQSSDVELIGLRHKVITCVAPFKNPTEGCGM